MTCTLRRSYAYCDRLSRREAGNFYPAFRVLPREQRQATCALYAFFRIADDLSDRPGPLPAKRLALAAWRTALRQALAGAYSHPLHAALHDTVNRYGVPAEYLEAAIDGVEMDLAPVAYRTFDELRLYCYRVASVVGLACIHVWGFTAGEARAHAESAGIAFQLTNILRDLGEDAGRGRVYLPAEDLERFGYDVARLARGEQDECFRALMQFEVARARGFYDAARPLVALLQPAGRAVFLAMARTYRGLLDLIEERGYDVFSRRVRLGPWRKLWLVLSALPARWGRGRGVVITEGDASHSQHREAVPSTQCSVATPFPSPPNPSLLTPHSSPLTVLIIGGGLAGLAAATALAPRGLAVTLLEARNRLGGRAGSFQDPGTGQLVDACQHVSMGCCTNLAYFCRGLGLDRLLRPQRCLYFLTPDGKLSRFRADSWPAPLHLLRSFLGLHYLSGGEKLRVAWGLARLRYARAEADPPFRDWLVRHGQTPRTISRFWGLVLTSALNETPERIGLRYARKVFLDGFLRHRRGFEVELPAVPLGRLYGAELQAWLAQHQVRVGLQQGVKALRVQGERIAGVELRQGGFLEADWYIAAVPFDRLLDLLPADVIEREPYFGKLRNLEVSPITSVHLWLDRPILHLPHVVLVDGVGQWVFNRGEVEAGVHYVQVVVSASRQFRELGHDEVQRRVLAELRQLFPAARVAVLRRARVVTEHAATFSAVPGVDRWRPAQATPLTNLLVAGDWTATGWPATMEGAVRSGYLAAEALLRNLGIDASLVQPDL
jgi:squalene synthase HpnD